MRLLVFILALSIIACCGCISEKKQAEIQGTGQQNSMAPGPGFYDIENWSGTPSRWMQANATFTVNSTDDQTATLSLKAISFYRNRTLEIFSGNELLARNFIPAEGFVDIVVPIHQIKGTNSFRFHTLEGCERPIDKPELNNPDQRCLSVSVQNMTILRV